MDTSPDWSTRITDLERKGWSLKAIGDEVGLASSSVSDIKHRSTSEPKGMAAVKLYELHLRVLSEPAPESAPEGVTFINPASIAAAAIPGVPCAQGEAA
jgi:hypothetical protein